MEKVVVRLGKPTERALADLEKQCQRARKKLKSEESEAKLPVFMEFAGSPKSGKSTIIGKIAHFLRRQGMQVVQPAEGASLRTPGPLKDDWLAFNAWSGCYALQSILEDCFLDPPADIVLLDRGLFDIAAWMEFLCAHQGRITTEDRQKVISFFTLDLWRRRQNAVFLFTADHKTSMYRENDGMLATAAGSVMNESTLQSLLESYSAVSAELDAEFLHLYQVDTSFVGNKRPDFQMVAFQVAEKIVEIIAELGTQEILVTESIEFEGFQTSPDVVQRTRQGILHRGKPLFLDREEAEKSSTYQQVVPYALLKDEAGRYFRARRRADLRRKELQKKLTILVGGHAEKRDWNPANPESVFETCLRRELEEELVGIRVGSIKPLGFIYDPHTPVGLHHLAYIHEVGIGGKVAVRRQAIDKEFGREPVEWVNEEQIRQCMSALDPWSQLVAHKLFDAPLPPSDNLFPRQPE